LFLFFLTRLFFFRLFSCLVHMANLPPAICRYGAQFSQVAELQTWPFTPVLPCRLPSWPEPSAVVNAFPFPPPLSSASVLRRFRFFFPSRHLLSPTTNFVYLTLFSQEWFPPLPSPIFSPPPPPAASFLLHFLIRRYRPPLF